MATPIKAFLGKSYTKNGITKTYFYNPTLAGVVFIVDSRHKLSKDDVMFYNFIVEKGVPFILVASKYDKLNQSEKAAIKKHITKDIGIERFVPTSATNFAGLEELKGEIAKLIEN